MKLINTLLLAATTLLSATAQNVNNIQLDHVEKIHARKTINVPNLNGFQALKCDFHIHTVFSDGIVWPTFRVQEAWEEGLDAIAITDHIENNPSKPHVGGDDNSAYEIALPEAKKKDIMLIHAGEITRAMPPGHLNALFLENTNLLDVKDPMEALRAAKAQGAFIIWNHPGWKAQQPDTCLWMEMHEEIFQEGMINAIEVFNEKEWYPVVMDWCLNRDIAIVGTSDIHDITAHYYDLENSHRPMTIVYAKERTQASLKEALLAKRTIAYFDHKLAGKPEIIEDFFHAAIEVKALNPSTFSVINTSDVPFVLNNEEEHIIIPEQKTILMSKAEIEQTYNVSNLIIGTNKTLSTKILN